MSRSRQKYRKPSERAAGFILSIFDWIKDIVGSPSNVIPRGHVIKHQGRELDPGRTLRYKAILLVEDDPATAGNFIGAIRKHYTCGSIMIYVAHAFDAAVNFFDNEDVDLVIMDADLDDEDGDGAELVRKFNTRRPELPILANSSSRISNRKLTGYGAVKILGKDPRKLEDWLIQHDPAEARN
ncbi:MAG: response regulator [Deltaproteobacteria bacterium]|nr:response regulator [Deltaproteobacteria bacterium]